MCPIKQSYLDVALSIVRHIPEVKQMTQKDKAAYLSELEGKNTSNHKGLILIPIFLRRLKIELAEV